MNTDFRSVLRSSAATEEKLELLKAVQAIKTYEGCDVIFECELSKRTKAQVTWYCDNRKLIPGDRIRYKMRQCRLQLCIERVTMDDAGLYECRIGRLSTEAPLEVVPEKVWESETKFVVGLKNCEVSSGDTMRLYCELNRPDRVVWTHNDADVENDSKTEIIIKNEGMVHALVVLDADEFDSGTYKATVNEDLSSSCEVTAASPPRLTLYSAVNDQNHVVMKAATPACLTVSYYGIPEPTLKWQRKRHDEKVFQAIEDDQIVNSEGLSKLEILHPTVQDAGNYYVTAMNKHGEVQIYFSTFVVDCPSSPSNISVSEVTANAVSLCWNEPDDDGGLPITGYVVERQAQNTNNWKTVSRNVQDCCLRVGNLTSGQKYTFRISCYNETGISAWSEISEYIEAKDHFGKPQAPQSFQVTGVHKDRATLSWSHPAFDGGSNITAYLIEIRKKSDKKWKKCAYLESDTTNFTVRPSTIKKGNSYYFRVQAENRAGIGEASTSDLIYISDPMDVPTPPICVRCQYSSTTSLLVSWEIEKEEEITHYSIERLRQDGHWTRLEHIEAVPSQTSFEDDNVVEGKTYSYRIRSVNEAGESDPSTQSDFIRVKCAPTILSHDDSVSICEPKPLQLRAVIDGIPSPETEWWYGNTRLKNMTADGASVKITKSDTAASLSVDPSSRKFHPGSYKLVVRNEIGVAECQFHVEVIDVPSAVNDVTVDDVTSTSCRLSWERPSDDGGTKVDGYLIEREEEGSDDWIEAIQCFEDSTGCSLTNMTPGKTYRYRIRPYNVCGYGPLVELDHSVVARNPATSPSCPTNLTHANITKTSIQLWWAKPDSDGGAPIIGYLIEKMLCKEDSYSFTDDSFTPCNVIPQQSTCYDVEDLINNRYYRFRVRALNHVGLGVACSPTNVILIKEYKDGPTVQLVEEVASGVAVKSGDNVGIAAYVGGKPFPAISWLVNAILIENLETPLKYTCEVEGDLATLQIKHIKRHGYGEYSIQAENHIGKASASCFVQVFDRPGKPSNIDVTNVTCSSCLVSWSEPDNGGISLRSYDVRVKKEVSIGKGNSKRVDWETISFESISPEKYCYQVGGLAEGDTYQIQIQANNELGSSPWASSNHVIAKNPFNPPLPPFPPHCDDITRDAMTVTWDKTLDDGGLPITVYHVEMRAGDKKKPWKNIAQVGKDQRSFRATGLAESKTHYFRVIGENEMGIGQASEASDGFTTKDPLKPPHKAHSPKIAEVINTSVRLSWRANASSDRVDAYTIEMRQRPTDGDWKGDFVIWKSGITGTEQLVDRLIPTKRQYQFRIIAYNEAGNSPPSETSDIITCRATLRAPNKPNSLEIAETSKNAITLQWNFPVDPDQCQAVEGYMLEKREVGKKSWKTVSKDVKDLFYTVKSLKVGRTYEFRLAAFNSAGTSGYLQSEATAARDVVRVPNPPSQLHAEVESSQVNIMLTWENPAFNGGSHMVAYLIEQYDTKTERWIRVGERAPNVNNFRTGRLTEHVGYKYRVSAENEVGIGRPSEESELLILEKPSTLPSPPHQLSTLRLSSTSCKIVWKPPTDGMGSGVTHYLVQRYDRINNELINLAEHVRALSFTAYELEPQTEYTFAVCSCNQNGCSKPAFVTFVTPEILQLATGEQRDEADHRYDKINNKSEQLLNRQLPVLVGSDQAEPTTQVKSDEIVPPVEKEKITQEEQLLLEEPSSTSTYLEQVQEVIEAVTRKHIEEESKIEPETESAPKPVYEPPTIKLLHKLETGKDVQAGEYAELKALVAGLPVPKIEWSGPNSERKLNKSVRAEQEYSILSIRNTKRRDDGVYTITAINTAGHAEATVRLNVLDRPSIPEGPLSISKITTKNALVSWLPSTDNGGSPILRYCVERCDITGSGSWEWPVYTEDGSATSCDLYSFEVNKIYQFRLRAENKYGESDWLSSEEVAVRLLSVVPSAPSLPWVNIVYDNGVHLEWDEPADDGGAPVTGYTIEQIEEDGDLWDAVTIQPIAESEYRIGGLIKDQRYSFRVRALNREGLSDASAATEMIKIHRNFNKPNKPLDLQVVSRDPFAVTLEWREPEADGLCPITGYYVERCTDGFDEWEPVNDEAVLVTLVKMTDVHDDRSYQFRVLACNDAGRSEPSEPVLVADTIEKPFVELKTKCKVLKGDEILINATVSGCPYPDLTWYKNHQELNVWQRWSEEKTMEGIELRLLNCVRSDTGSYSLNAKNKVDQAMDDVFINVIDKPGPCANVRLADVGKFSCLVCWDVPEDDGGIPVNRYLIEIMTRKSKKWVFHSACKIENFQFTFDKGEQYKFRVCAENECGNGEFQDTDTFVPDRRTLSKLSVLPDFHPLRVSFSNDDELSDLTALSRSSTIMSSDTDITPLKEESIEPDEMEAPSIILPPKLACKMITAKAGTTLRLSAHIGGIPRPDVHWTGQNPASVNRIRTKDKNRTSTMVIQKVQRIDEGDYTIVATNEVGTADTTIALGVFDKPSVPVGPLQIKEITTKSATVSWNKPTEDGGAPVLRYCVERREVTADKWVMPVCTFDGHTTKCEMNNFNSHKTYQFRVRAENKYGESGWLISEEVVCKLQFDVPCAPNCPRVRGMTDSSLNLEWDEPEIDGGAPITGYTLEQIQEGDDHWDAVTIQPIKQREYQITSLNKNHEYAFRVRAVNRIGSSEPSIPTLMTKIKRSFKEPGPPHGMHIYSRNISSVTLQWNEPKDDGGSVITGYFLERHTNDEEGWEAVNREETTETTFIVEDIDDGVDYQFRVAACNAAGRGKTSEPLIIEEVVETPTLVLTAEEKVQLGDEIVIRATVTGRPRPDFYWFLNEEPLTNLNRWSREIEQGEYCFKLACSEQKDSGIYSLVVRNKAGQAGGEVTVKVIHKPGVVDNLKCVDDGDDHYLLSWDEPDSTGNLPLRYLIEEKIKGKFGWTEYANTTDCSLRLEKKECAESSFKISAVNDNGKGRSIVSPRMRMLREHTATALLEGKKVTIRSSFDDIEEQIKSVVLSPDTMEMLASVSPDKNRKKSSSTSDMGELMPVALPEEVLPSIELDPKIIDGVSARCGSLVRFSAHIYGVPKPKTEWQGIHEDSREKTTIKQYKDTTTLVISNIARIDSGEYVLVASNQVGKSKQSVYLDVFDRPYKPVGPLEIGEVTSNSAVLAWNKPEDNGGSPVLKYYVQKRKVTNDQWLTAVTTKDASRTQAKVTRLQVGTEYQFRVLAENMYGTSEALVSEPVLVERPFGNPDAPESPRIMDLEDRALTLLWKEPANDGGSEVTGYLVEQQEKGVNYWSNVETKPIVDTKYRISGLRMEREYSFRVSAVNEAGPSEPSESTSFICLMSPNRTPSQPTGLSLESTDNSTIILHWNEPVDDGGCPITCYFVEKRLEEAEDWVKVGEEPVILQKLKVANLDLERAYDFRVVACNLVGASKPSKSIYVHPLLEPPNILLTAPDKVSIGSELVIYAVVQGRPFPELKWLKDDEPFRYTAKSRKKETTEGVSLCIDSATREDAGNYALEVRNQAGKCVKETFIDVIQAPKKCVNLRIEKITESSCIFTWGVPAEDGGSDVTSYIVESKEKSSGIWRYAGATKALSFEIKVEEGREYKFRVCPENEYGRGEFAELNYFVQAPVPVSVPGKPQNVDCEVKRNSVVLVTWDAPEKVKIEHYLLSIQIEGQEDWHEVGSCDESYYIIEGLDTACSFRFNVKAVNEGGESEAAYSDDYIKPQLEDNCRRVSLSEFIQEPEEEEVRKQTPEPPQLFVGPAAQKITTQAGKSVKLSARFIGTPKPNIEWIGPHTTSTSKKSIKSEQDYTTLSIRKNQRCDDGIYTIIASNELGTAQATIRLNVLDKPSIPTGPLNIVKITTKNAVVSWQSSTDDGGSPILKYCVERRDVAQDRWMLPVYTKGASKTKCKLSRFESDRRYQFRVRAENKYGESDWLYSEEIVVKLMFDVPCAPDCPRIKHITDTGLTLEWEQPEDDGGSAVTGYTIEQIGEGDAFWDAATIQPVVDKEYRVDGLITNHKYAFRVSAISSIGLSEASTPTEMTEIKRSVRKPGAPIEVHVASRDVSSVTLRWNEPLEDCGCPITGYYVERNMVDGCWEVVNQQAVLVTKLKMFDIEDDTSHHFRVFAVNEVGKGPTSDVIIVEERVLEPTVTLETSEFVEEGEELVMKAQILGKPYPQMVWSKNDEPIFDMSDFEREVVDDWVLLKLSSCKRSDAGRYALTVSNSVGTSQATVEAKVVCKPDVCVNLFCSSIFNNACTFSWDSPDDDGGLPITKYIVEKQEKNSQEWEPVLQTTDQQVSIEIDKRSPVKFRVSAQNKLGRGPSLEFSDYVEAQDLTPCQPSGVSVTVIRDGVVQMSWAKQDSEEVSSYKIFSMDRLENTWVESGTSVVNTFCVESLNPDHFYLFKIVAINEFGASNPWVADDFIQPRLPSIPQIIIEKPSVEVDASKPFHLRADLTGHPAPITNWTRSDDSSPVLDTIQEEHRGDQVSLKWKHAERQHEGIYILRASNTSGVTEAQFHVTVFDKPSVCQGPVQISDVHHDRCTIKWKKPLDDGGCPVTGYQVEKVETARKIKSLVSANLSECECTIKTLKEGYDYTFRVRANNRLGSGPPLQSEAIVARATRIVPYPPVNLTACQRDNSNVVNLTWEPPAYDGGSEIINYKIEKCENGSPRWYQLGTRKIRSLRVNCGGFRVGFSYEFRVSAENEIGVGRASDWSESITIKECEHFVEAEEVVEEFEVDAELTSLAALSAGAKLEFEQSTTLKDKRRNLEVPLSIGAEAVGDFPQLDVDTLTSGGGIELDTSSCDQDRVFNFPDSSTIEDGHVAANVIEFSQAGADQDSVDEAIKTPVKKEAFPDSQTISHEGPADKTESVIDDEVDGVATDETYEASKHHHDILCFSDISDDVGDDSVKKTAEEISTQQLEISGDGVLKSADSLPETVVQEDGEAEKLVERSPEQSQSRDLESKTPHVAEIEELPIETTSPVIPPLDYLYTDPTGSNVTPEDVPPHSDHKKKICLELQSKEESETAKKIEEATRELQAGIVESEVGQGFIQDSNKLINVPEDAEVKAESATITTEDVSLAAASVSADEPAKAKKLKKRKKKRIPKPGKAKEPEKETVEKVDVEHGEGEMRQTEDGDVVSVMSPSVLNFPDSEITEIESVDIIKDADISTGQLEVEESNQDSATCTDRQKINLPTTQSLSSTEDVDGVIEPTQDESCLIDSLDEGEAEKDDKSLICCPTTEDLQLESVRPSGKGVKEASLKVKVTKKSKVSKKNQKKQTVLNQPEERILSPEVVNSLPSASQGTLDETEVDIPQGASTDSNRIINLPDHEDIHIDSAHPTEGGDAASIHRLMMDNVTKEEKAISATLDVHTPQTKPVFDQSRLESKHVKVVIGTDFVLPLPLTGHPTPEVEVRKNDKKLNPADLRHRYRDGKFSIRDCYPNDTGKYSICAINPHGTDGVYIKLSVIDRPSCPRGPIKFKSVDEERFSISWRSSKEYGGSESVTYTVELLVDEDENTWIEKASAITGLSLKLPKSSEYEGGLIRVKAENMAGYSQALVSDHAVPDKVISGLPSKPGRPIASETTQTSIQVYWSRPEKDGGCAITGYFVEQKRRNTGITWKKCNRSPAQTRDLLIVNLTENNEYKFRVAAENKIGVGPWSDSSEYYCAKCTNNRCKLLRLPSCRSRTSRLMHTQNCWSFAQNPVLFLSQHTQTMHGLTKRKYESPPLKRHELRARFLQRKK